MGNLVDTIILLNNITGNVTNDNGDGILWNKCWRNKSNWSTVEIITFLFNINSIQSQSSSNALNRIGCLRYFVGGLKWRRK